MLLNGGSWNGARMLKPETVALMDKNHTGDIPAGVMKTQMPALSNDVDFFPGAPIRWGLGYMLNVQPGPNGRSAGTVSWGGIFNTYYWIDPSKRVTGLIMTQILPFADPRVLEALRAVRARRLRGGEGLTVSLLPLGLDELLTTTRAVRRRLDLDRPVERSVIEECLQIALQAPSGSNRQRWHFVVVTDQDKRRRSPSCTGRAGRHISRARRRRPTSTSTTRRARPCSSASASPRSTSPITSSACPSS